MNKELLYKHLEIYILKANNNIEFNDLQKRKEREDYYKNYTSEKIVSMNEDEFYEYISKLWAMIIWGNKHYIVDKYIADNGFENLKKSIAYLLYGNETIEVRWDTFKEKIKGLKYPFMLKPVSEGSSLGMYKVNTPDEMEECFKKSLEYGQDVMVEEYLEGKSVTVGVLEDGEKMFATEILEFRTKTEWYDYEAKYTAGMTEFVLPAELSEEMTKKVKQIAIDAFNACACKGVSRVDFLVTDDMPYVLEINTSPGMTDLSDLPAQSKAMGIDYDTLVQIILNGASLNK